MEKLRGWAKGSQTDDQSFPHDAPSTAAEELRDFPHPYDSGAEVVCQNISHIASGNCVLKLTPTIPQEFACADIHKVFFSQFGSRYDTCFRIGEEVFVRMKSPDSAIKQRGASVTVKEVDYTVEFTGYHSNMYVCDDVKGATTEVLLQAIDCPPLAKEYGIGLVRQQNNGPLVAFIFDRPLDNCAKFTLDVERWPLEFMPVHSKCPLCATHHESQSWACKQLEILRHIAPPGGYLGKWEYQLPNWQMKLVKEHDLEEGHRFYSSHRLHKHLLGWDQNKVGLKAAKARFKYKYLGQTSEELEEELSLSRVDAVHFPQKENKIDDQALEA